MPLNHQEAQQCRDLLYNLFSEHGTNAEHLENLHEMFIAFVADYRRNDRQHESIITTYTQIRELLKQSETIFKAP